MGTELKNFTGDGQGVLLARYSRGDDAGNPDDIQVDLATGEIKRVTSHPDWDEDIHETAQRHLGRRWRVVGSARGAGLLEAFSQLRRPSAIDVGVSALPFIAFGQHRAAIAEPWLIDDRGERDGYIGQPLLPGAVAAGWDSRATTTFKPDGTAAVTWQLRVGGAETRVVIARFTSREPIPEPAARQTPDATWAPRLPGFVPPEPRVPSSRDGAVAGRMIVTLLPAPDPFDLLIEVRYKGFADREGYVIDGVESSLFTPGGVYGRASLYNASLTLSGAHQGWLRASNVLLVPTVGIRGKIESEVDGRRLTFGQ